MVGRTAHPVLAGAGDRRQEADMDVSPLRLFPGNSILGHSPTSPTTSPNNVSAREQAVRVFERHFKFKPS